MAPLSAKIEAFIGRRLTNQRNRVPKLVTRANPLINSLPPTLLVSSPLGPSPSPLLMENTPLAEDRFPNLSWALPNDVDPNQVKEYVLVVEDPDAPLPNPVVHGLYYGLPEDRTNVGPDDFKASSGTNEAAGDAGSQKNFFLSGNFYYGANRRGSIWSGPRPVLDHGPHRYFFQVIALGEKLSVGSKDKTLTKEQLIAGLRKENVLAWGEWVGTFERKSE